MTDPIGGDPPRYCPYCGGELVDPDDAPERVPRGTDEAIRQTIVWRRHRRVHLPYFDVPEDREGAYLVDEDDDDGPFVESEIETQTYEVAFHDEHVEYVTVEAATKGEAKERAEDLRTYDGEFTHTIHTETRAQGEQSAPSEEYLEWCGIPTGGDEE